MMVLDASVVVKTYLEEAARGCGHRTAGRAEPLLAPEVIRLEVAGALAAASEKVNWKPAKPKNVAGTGWRSWTRDSSR